MEGIRLVAKEAAEYLRDVGDFSIDASLLVEKMTRISQEMDSKGTYDRPLWWQRVMDEIGVKVEQEVLLEWTSIYWSVASRNSPYDDALDTLPYLKGKGYKLGLVTNTDGRGGNKARRISHFPLIDQFDVILIGGENDLKPKPNVQIFLEACERLGVPASSCAMIGDDPLKDTIPAKRAGLLSLLLDREVKYRNPELYADFIIYNLKELEDLL